MGASCALKVKIVCPIELLACCGPFPRRSNPAVLRGKHGLVRSRRPALPLHAARRPAVQHSMFTQARLLQL